MHLLFDRVRTLGFFVHCDHHNSYKKEFEMCKVEAKPKSYCHLKYMKNNALGDIINHIPSSDSITKFIIDKR